MKMPGIVERKCALLMAAGLLLLYPAFALEPEMDTDELLKRPKNNQTLQGNAWKQHMKNQPSETNPLVIRVQTFQDAVIAEKDTVDWYGWYLSIRGYLEATGGLNQCTVGTPIKIYKQGRIEALSVDPLCKASVAWRKFPLPENTRLEALILPVRSGKLPPASPEELKMRLEQSKQLQQVQSKR
ncbi:MAG TPA: hypothetical protein V6C99_01065 [Oculatellaceae cyanobacterium]|jgi:hypothetical protein